MHAHHETSRGRDVVWEIPPNPRAIVVIAHALNKEPFAFFDFGPGCRLWYGLPEERLATLDALENGDAVVALKSITIEWITWPLETSPDIDNAVALLAWWTKRHHHLEELPLVAWGQSIGGAFVASLGASPRLRLDALVLVTTIDIPDQLSLASPKFPPTVFGHLAGNRYQGGLPSVAQVEAMMEALTAFGVAVSRVTLPSQPVTPSYLAGRAFTA